MRVAGFCKWESVELKRRCIPSLHLASCNNPPNYPKTPTTYQYPFPQSSFLSIFIHPKMRTLFLPFVLLLLFASCAEEDNTEYPDRDTFAKNGEKGDTLKRGFYVMITGGQSNTIDEVYDGESCAQATARAIRDTTAGKLHIVTFGYPADMCSFSLWHSIIEKEYGIEAEHLGCVVYGWESCYNEVMYAAIEKKYGPGLWKKVNARVDSVCAHEREPEYIRELPVVERPDPPVYYRYNYIGPHSTFGYYTGSLVRLPRSMRRDSIHRKLVLLCQVDTSGKLRSWEYIPGETGSAYYYDSITPLMRKRLDHAVRRAARKAYWIIPVGSDGKKHPLEEQTEIRFRWKEED